MTNSKKLSEVSTIPSAGEQYPKVHVYSSKVNVPKRVAALATMLKESNVICSGIATVDYGDIRVAMYDTSGERLTNKYKKQRKVKT